LLEIEGGGSCRDSVPHRRMVRLAAELYPDMQLVEVSQWCAEWGTVDALARQVLSRACP
jgi:hypothetical protein